MQTCSCIKGHYDFKIESCEMQRLFYTDSTEWMVGEQYVIPETYIVEILPPNKTQFVSKVAQSLSTTAITAEDLGLKNLSDGVYCFKVSAENGGCGKEYKKSTAIFPNISCCLNRAFSTDEGEKYDSLKEVEKFLTFAKNDSELGNVKSASDNYKIAKKKLERLKCDCNCN